MAVNRFPRAGWLFIWLSLGLAVGMTNLFAPIHELAHATVANNNGVRTAYVTGWADMRMDPLDRPALLAGWVSEVFLFSVAAIILALSGISPKRRWMTGGFWAGAALVHWIRAFNSSDFTDQIRYYFNSQFPNDPVSATAYYNAYREGLVDTWSMFGFWTFAVVGLTVLLCLLPRKVIAPK
jgi:hypothetical protein